MNNELQLLMKCVVQVTIPSERFVNRTIYNTKLQHNKTKLTFNRHLTPLLHDRCLVNYDTTNLPLHLPLQLNKYISLLSAYLCINIFR